ncbi:NAD(+) kinase [Malassezia sp. CBS 17886]|nr:NAD(+) kinase [Malassezia sp. CBS 17886]
MLNGGAKEYEYSAERPPSLDCVYHRSLATLRAPPDPRIDRALASSQGATDSDSGNTSSPDTDSDDRMRSITSQLAQTAVDVREMSKQLVRARVHSDVDSVLIITKARDNRLVLLTREISLWLMTTPRTGRERGLIVYVDAQLETSRRFDVAGMRRDHPELFVPMPRRRASDMSASGAPQNGEGQLRFWTGEMCTSMPHLFDIVLTLGGDGTVLFCSWLFQTSVPPVVPFSLGSLGFLTPFDFAQYKPALVSILEHGVRLNIRMRFRATVYRAIPPTDPRASRYLRRAIKSGETGEIIMRNIEEEGWQTIEVSSATRDAPGEASGKARHKDRAVRCFGTRPVESFEILNDLVVDRGPSPFVSMLEVYADNRHLTTAQADGLCISTPTGSTAYSLSAGGSLVYPEIPAILITPICPHTLSFRPMLLPDSMELRIAVPHYSRSNAWASFDGRGRIEIGRAYARATELTAGGDHIKVSASPYPFPTVTPEDQPSPWFDSVSRTLNWNQREKQKSFVMVEESAGKRPHKSHKLSPLRRGAPHGHDSAKAGGPTLEPTDSDGDEQEVFDIDDRAPAATQANSNEPSRGPTPDPSTQQRDHAPDLQPLTRAHRGQPPRRDAPPAAEGTMASTPDRFGRAGPPRPVPLSTRHLADVDSRLRSAIRTAHTEGTSEHPAHEGMHQAIVVYGHDDSDDSDDAELA